MKNKDTMQKYLGIDVGSERVGVAVSDDGGSIAFPLAIMERKGCVEQIVRHSSPSETLQP